MNRILAVCLFALTLGTLTPLGETLPAAATNDASFAGTWKGTMNDLPGIDLTIQEAGGKVSGTVVFYFQKRADVNSPWHATADPALPLLNPHVNGRTLTFEVEHHVCDGCADLGPNVTFRMELAGANEARLIRFKEEGTEGPRMKLVRSSQSSAQTAPPLQAGISVEMPRTSHATPMPEADQQDAVIVTVTGESSLYLGINHVGLDLLPGLLKGDSRRTLYVKADARAPYAIVVKVLDAAAEAGKTTVLLSSQRESPSPGKVEPPRGFTVVTGESQAKPAKLSL